MPTVALALLLAAAGSALAAELPQKVALGDAGHSVASGVAWLVANRWGAYPAVLVGAVQNGRFEPRYGIQFPRYWEQAFDYRLYLAVSERTVELPSTVAADDAYGWFGMPPEYLKKLTVYVASPLPKEGYGRDWAAALGTMGRVMGETLVLPRPALRTVRLLYPDGKPLAGRTVQVSLYGSSENHCGVAVGIWLGDFVTDARGEVHVTTTNSELAVTTQYFEQVEGGPAGPAYALLDNFVVDRGEAATVKHLWTLPEHEYVVRLRTAAGQPIEHAHLEACLFQPPCMSACGPLPAPVMESDATGTIRFRAEDLRKMGTIAVVDGASSKWDLSDEQMRELLEDYRLDFVWK